MNLPATLARAGPWLVAFAPAWFVYDSLITTFNVPMFVAIPIAAGVELTGVAAFDTWLWLLAWNRKKRKIDPTAPDKLALLPVAVYLVSGIILTAVLKQNAVLALFFVLAAAGYGTIAIQADQSRREAEVKASKAEARAERKERKAERSRERPTNNGRPPKPYEHSPEFDGLLAIVAERSRLAAEQSGTSDFGQADVQRWTGKKRTTAYQILKYGQNAGVIEQVGRGKFVCLNGAGKDG
jgi:signal transduction histidine kinase